MVNLVPVDGIQDGLRRYATQADMSACRRRDGPCEAPTVGVEHRQRPQIPGWLATTPLGSPVVPEV